MGAVDSIFKIPELTKRLWFTFWMLVIYRMGIFVPTPGIDAERFRRIFEGQSAAAGNLYGLVNMFTGGALENFSIFALGIMPYISGSIIMQLLTTVWKPLEELQKEGAEGRRIITRYTRIGTVALSLFQGYMIAVGLQAQGVVATPGFRFCIITALTLCAGTMFIMWLGEQITERGIGNGISIIIFAGIVARMPATLLITFDLAATTGEPSPLGILAILAIALATIAFIVFVERCQRRIPIQYPRRAVGRHMTQASTQHLPLKVNMSGVIAAVFASTLIGFPVMVAQMAKLDWLNEYLVYITPPHVLYEVLFAALIMFFCFFYTAIVFDPNKVSEDLKKAGGFIPTVRPGRDTADFLNTILSRLTLWGGIYVCIICIFPTIIYRELGASAFAAFFGGTAVLIVVGVMMDTVAQIQSHILARNYEGFMAKGPGKVRGASSGINIRGQLIKR